LEEKTINPGDNNFDVTSYLNEGEIHKFWIKVYSGEYISEVLYYTARLINISITSNFNLNTVTKVGNTINIPGTITGI